MLHTLSLLIVIAGAGAGQAPPRLPACSILTRELALQYSTEEGKRVVQQFKPIKDELGPQVSACKVGRISLMLDPFPKPDQVRNTMGSRWQPVPGVGDAAFFNGDSAYANLYVWSGARHFTLQISVGTADSAEALKPNAIGLAKAVIARLK